MNAMRLLPPGKVKTYIALQAAVGAGELGVAEEVMADAKTIGVLDYPGNGSAVIGAQGVDIYPDFAHGPGWWAQFFGLVPHAWPSSWSWPRIRPGRPAT